MFYYISRFNTYGLRSINTHTFNGPCCSPNRHFEHEWVWSASAEERNLINTLLRINNLLFNVLGYLPGTREVSGRIRMGIGGSIVVVSLAIKTLFGIRGHWLDEAFATGSAQIFRGSIEAAPFNESIINASLDVIGTVANIWAERHFDPSKHPKRHHLPDPSYWLPFQFLRLV